MRVGIIGAGLGGLLSGGALAKQRHKVTVFERLPYHGGRFTNIEYKGYQLSTGALHMIPHGSTGPFGTMLKRLGVDVPIVRTKPPGLFRFGGKNYTHKELQDLFGSWNKVKLIKLTADLRYSNGGDEPYLEWVRKRISHKKVFDLANSFCRWALSLDADEISSREAVSITKNIDRYGAPGVPIGGCKAVVDGLAEELKRNGGEIHYQTSVEEIITTDGRVTGLSTSDETFEFDAVISNIGPKSTISLCKHKEFSRDYIDAVSSLRPANGIKISFSSDIPLVGHTCTFFTPEAERIGGLVELTHIDPALAPKGRHLLMSHQKLYGGDIGKEIEGGIEDLRNIFPGFDRHCEILMVQCYKNHWPVNRAASGTHLGPQTPIQGLYNVGDGIKPMGFMETEGVAKGVELMLEKFNKDMQEV
ncbi:MAG: phytoene desaturase family protein [Candidatus Hydrothermarchaeales archaeon]